MVRMTSSDKIDTRNRVAKMDAVDVLDRKLVMVSESTDDQVDFTKTHIYRQLRPLLTLMRIFGVFFRRNTNTDGSTNTEITVVYCAFISLIMILNVARSFTVYRVADQFDHVLVQRVLFTIWSTECTCKALLMFVYCFSQDGLPLFFREWYIVCKDNKLDSFSLVMMKKYIVLALVFILVNSVVFTLVLIYVPMLEHIYLDVVWRDASKSDLKFIYKIVLGGLAILNSSSSMFPVSIFLVLSCAVAKRLRKFTEEFSASVKEDDFHDSLQDFRLRHQSLCTLVEILDRIFAPMMAAVFFANIPMFCLVLYTMVTSIDIHISLVLINLFWLSFILLQMTIVSVTAAFVNVKVSSVTIRLFVWGFTPYQQYFSYLTATAHTSRFL